MVKSNSSSSSKNIAAASEQKKICLRYRNLGLGCLCSKGEKATTPSTAKLAKQIIVSLQDDLVLRTQCLIAKLLDIRPWHVTWHQLTSREKPTVFKTVPPKKKAESILCPLCVHTAARKDWHTKKTWKKQDKQIRVWCLRKFRKSHSSRIFSHWHLHCFLFFSLFFTCLACQISTYFPVLTLDTPLDLPWRSAIRPRDHV